MFKVTNIHTDVVATIDAEQEKVRDAFKMGDYDAMAETFTVDCLYIAPLAPAIIGRPGEILWLDIKEGSITPQFMYYFRSNRAHNERLNAKNKSVYIH